MTLPRRAIAGKTAYKELENENGELVVWWYYGIRKKLKSTEEPKVLVCFRRILPDGSLGDFKHKRLPITSLGQFRVGTIWKEQKRFEEFVYETKTFRVNFSEGGWQHIQIDNANTGPISPSVYPLPTIEKEPSQLIRFNAIDVKGSGVSLYVPCIEFFSRCYGRSQYIKHVLTLYPWEEAQNRFFAPFPVKPEGDKWHICLRERVLNGDSVFLAHAKYDPYTNHTVRSIYSKFEKSFANNAQSVYPEIQPWFTGPAAMKVSGVWIEEGKSFLALQIVGTTDPGGVEIHRGRRSRVQNPTSADGASADDLIGIPRPRIMNPPPIVTVTGQEEPSTDTGAIIIADEDFEVLGRPRRVKRVKFDVEQGSYKQVPVPDENTRLFSGGESHGTGSGVGYAMYKADQIMESHGVLRDIWDALIWFHDNHPEVIGPPESYSYEEGFCDNPEPTLIAYQAFADDVVDIKGATRNWPFLSVEDRIRRGALLARIKVGEECIHFFEMQRRFKITEDDPGNGVITEESFRGMVFKLKDGDDLEEWIETLMDASRRTEGVLVSIAPRCPGMAELYKHNTAHTEKIPCEAAVRNALKKMGVKLPAGS